MLQDQTTDHPIERSARERKRFMNIVSNEVDRGCFRLRPYSCRTRETLW
jgi:hypothetical protein